MKTTNMKEKKELTFGTERVLVEALGKCDYSNCNEVAYVECGEVWDEKQKRSRIGKWCLEHCPKKERD